ncbi:MAG TPA: RtcB family protein [Xanthobacteraceae bacterium]|nr:RtcB family protein [Xanthobacteraceae bacterium]
MTEINGKTLISWGVPQGPWFPAALAAARQAIADGLGDDAVRSAALACGPTKVEQLPLREFDALGFHVNAIPETLEEGANIFAVKAHMRELMRVPTVVAGAIMPDACPAGSAPGTIPVGGVVAAKDAIHPGMHSADICCSVAVSVFGRDVDPTAILDAGMTLSHFGGGGRPRGGEIHPPERVLSAFDSNPFLKPIVGVAIEHFATQGDGNHFFFVGRLRSTGEIALVTHHGSRAPGARLYKAGMEVAERHRRAVSPETAAHNAWIPAESDDGRAYWDALQIIREWTKANHFAIHDRVGRTLGRGLRAAKHRFWNEHNFVFRKSDGLFYHAKGATPAWRDFAADTNGLTLIPLNMAEPILIVEGSDAPHALGFSPHGAGRNMSRTAYLKTNAGKSEAEMIAEQAPGIDVRYFCGVPDTSELPGAYKNAESVRRQIDHFGLARVIEEIEPIGNIMAGDWQRDAPWRRKRAAR